MGVFPNTLLLLQLGLEQTQDTSDESIWKQPLMEEEEEEAAINRAKASLRSRRRRRSNSLMKKMIRRRRRRSSGIEKRVSTLRSLVPNMNNNNNNDINYHEASTVGLEHLFTRTADYILSLQTRVRLMQTLVDVLSASSS